MSENKIFGYTQEQIHRQISFREYSVPPKISPITPTDIFLEPCIRGAEKVISDPQKRKMFKEIYRGW